MAIALNERNIPHEKCLVDLQNKPENFTSTYARASPARAKVPVLEVGDDVLLWNHLLTPHWVDAPELTFGIIFSHGCLRHNGRLCRYEQYLYDEAGKTPNEKWHPETSSAAFSQTLVGRV